MFCVFSLIMEMAPKTAILAAKTGHRFGGLCSSTIMSEHHCTHFNWLLRVYVKPCIVGGHFLTKYLLCDSFHTDEIKQCDRRTIMDGDDFFIVRD